MPNRLNMFLCGASLCTWSAGGRKKNGEPIVALGSSFGNCKKICRRNSFLGLQCYMWFPLDRFKAAWNTFFRGSMLVHRRTKQTTNHLRRGTRAQFSMDTLRLTWLPFVFTCFLISSLGSIKTDAATWQFATLSARACAQCSPWNVPSPATWISKNTGTH